MNITLIQLSSSDCIEENIKQLEKSLTTIVSTDVIVLPEMWSFMVPDSRSSERFKTLEQYDKLKNLMSSWAKEKQSLLIGGSIFAPSPNKTKIFNRCLAFNEMGEEIASYDKVHLFDNELNKSNPFKESASVLAGNELVCLSHQNIIHGLAICYDLRFPYHFQSLTDKGASIIYVPSAFTHTTGKAHWEVLLRARAIENQCFIIACNQTGSSVKNIHCYGHSLIASPWGEILHDMGNNSGAISIDIDLKQIDNVRTQMPTLSHRQLNTSSHYLKSTSKN